MSNSTDDAVAPDETLHPDPTGDNHARMPAPTLPRETRRVRLKPADPFDLIRLLARSQNDPKKAVAELIQNSLDAGATEVTVTRLRHHGSIGLSIFDNGVGVLPEMARPDALNHIATHIGHSYKQRLTPEQRYKLLQQGKYGIGLLGFWSVGRHLAIRSRVKGSETWVLQLEEEKSDGSVGPERGQKTMEPTWTEVVIRDLHPSAQRLMSGRRLADFLAFELRGQLLQRDVRLRVVDRLARGRAQQDFPVRPQRFQGVPLTEVREWQVEGHLPIRVELHYLPEEHGPGQVTLACAGTVVSNDLTLLEAVDLRHVPWQSGRLTGIVDAPFLDVAPGTRRGIVPNEKAEVFAAAMLALGERVSEWLARFSQSRAHEADRALHKRLKDVFREFHRRLPHYELFPVQAPHGEPGSGDSVEGAITRESVPTGEQDTPEIYEPGPLDSVRIVPGICRLPVRAEKSLIARALDATGRAIRSGVDFVWRMEGPGRLATKGAKATYLADAIGEAVVHIEARQAERRATSEARIEVAQEIEAPEREDVGIPEPIEVKDPSGRWRSRLGAGRWEFNGSHPDYLLVAADSARRFRYLATLLAKEVALRQVAGGPQEDRLLESLVEVIAAIEERLGRASRR